jgi:hypothetical protein
MICQESAKCSWKDVEAFQEFETYVNPQLSDAKRVVKIDLDDVVHKVEDLIRIPGHDRADVRIRDQRKRGDF